MQLQSAAESDQRGIFVYPGANPTLTFNWRLRSCPRRATYADETIRRRGYDMRADRHRVQEQHGSCRW